MHLHALLDDVFTGTAVLHIETVFKNRTVRTEQSVRVLFRPTQFVFSVALPDASESQEIAEILWRSSPQSHGIQDFSIDLRGLSLLHPSGATLSRTEAVEVRYQHLLLHDDLIESDEDESEPLINQWLYSEDHESTLLQVSSIHTSLTLLLDNLSEAPLHPWITRLSGATTDFHFTSRIQSGNDSVLINKLENGILELRGSLDQEPLRDRVVLALELLQGGELHQDYSLQLSRLKLFPPASRQGKAHFPLIRDMRHPLPYQRALHSLSAAIQNLDEPGFQDLKLSVRLHLEAKSLNGKIDLSFLTSMIFVERNDLRRQVHEVDTARLLGISQTASKIYNCLRDKLMHGKGGLEASYAEVLAEDFRNQPLPNLYKEFALKPVEQEHLFACIVFRLFERIDAYLWRKLVGVELDDVRRNTPYGLHPMHLPERYLESIAPKNTVAKLRDEIALLHSENALLRESLEKHQLQPPTVEGSHQ